MIRHFLTLSDLNASELRRLLGLAAQLKRRRSLGRTALTGRTIALVFQKPSMRTRAAFEVAVYQLGGTVISLGQDDIQLGRREPIRDVARALSRYVDGIIVRTFAHADAEEFAAYARVPVINGLSDLVHPCQALADVFTIREQFGVHRGVKAAYVGDGNNVLHSLAQGCARLGIHLAVATPSSYQPDRVLWSQAKNEAAAHASHLSWTSNPREAVRGAHVVYTDVWVSMGQERERAKRLKAFKGYQVNAALLKHAKPTCRVMHCLPAHRGEEISEEVMESRRSLMFEQAENRLHVQKALLMMLLGRKTK